MLTSKSINHTEIYFRVKLTLKMFSAKWDSALGGPETKLERGEDQLKDRNKQKNAQHNNYGSPILTLVYIDLDNIYRHSVGGRTDLYGAHGAEAAPDEVPEVGREDGLQDLLLVLPRRHARPAAADHAARCNITTVTCEALHWIYPLMNIRCFKLIFNIFAWGEESSNKFYSLCLDFFPTSEIA